MPRILVCSLPRLPVMVRDAGASHVVTLIKNIAIAPTPPGIHPDRHLRLDFSDITEEKLGETPPLPDHVAQLLTFVRAWDQKAPMVIHCFAGISRSTAAAFITCCALMPQAHEHQIAMQIRSKSPTAIPNSRLVRFADELLNRQGRMISAIEAMSPGVPSIEGTAFEMTISTLPQDW